MILVHNFEQEFSLLNTKKHILFFQINKLFPNEGKSIENTSKIVKIYHTLTLDIHVMDYLGKI